MSNNNLFTSGTKSWQTINVGTLDSTQVESDEIISNIFSYRDYDAQYARIGRTGLTFVANTPQNIVNYDIAQSGTLSGFNPTTGIFTCPSTGIYYIQYRMDNLAPAGPFDWSFRVLDPDSSSQYASYGVTLSGVDEDYEGGVFTNSVITVLNFDEKVILNYTTSGNINNIFAFFKIIKLF